MNLLHLGLCQRIKKDFLDLLNMARGGGDNFVVAGIGKRGDGITPIVRIGTAGNPALLFQLGNDLRKSGLVIRWQAFARQLRYSLHASDANGRLPAGDR